MSCGGFSGLLEVSSAELEIIKKKERKKIEAWRIRVNTTNLRVNTTSLFAHALHCFRSSRAKQDNAVIVRPKRAPIDAGTFGVNRMT